MNNAIGDYFVIHRVPAFLKVNKKEVIDHIDGLARNGYFARLKLVRGYVTYAAPAGVGPEVYCNDVEFLMYLDFGEFAQKQALEKFRCFCKGNLELALDTTLQELYPMLYDLSSRTREGVDFDFEPSVDDGSFWATLDCGVRITNKVVGCVPWTEDDLDVDDFSVPSDDLDTYIEESFIPSTNLKGFDKPISIVGSVELLNYGMAPARSTPVKMKFKPSFADWSVPIGGLAEGNDDAFLRSVDVFDRRGEVPSVSDIDLSSSVEGELVTVTASDTAPECKEGLVDCMGESGACNMEYSLHHDFDDPESKEDLEFQGDLSFDSCEPDPDDDMAYGEIDPPSEPITGPDLMTDWFPKFKCSQYTENLSRKGVQDWSHENAPPLAAFGYVSVSKIKHVVPLVYTIGTADDNSPTVYWVAKDGIKCCSVGYQIHHSVHPQISMSGDAKFVYARRYKSHLYKHLRPILPTIDKYYHQLQDGYDDTIFCDGHQYFCHTANVYVLGRRHVYMAVSSRSHLEARDTILINLMATHSLASEASGLLVPMYR
jgi:hypothetical protein